MSDSATSAHAEILPSQEPNMSIDIKAAAGEQESVHDKLKRLELELQMRTEERENYKNKLQAAQKELAEIKGAADLQVVRVGDNQLGENVDKLREDNNSLRQALNKAAELIKDKTSLCMSQERQNIALNNQIGSLKEVIKITKDLLNIRNMEVQHLQNDVDNMEGKIRMERERQSAMISKMDEAVKLNAELKSEYENQLKIFQDLKTRYEERVRELEKENKEQKSSSKTPKGDAINGKPEGPVNRMDIERKSLNRVDSVASDLDEFLDAHEDISSN